MSKITSQEQKLRDEFLLRQYYWALEEVQEELRSNFSIARRIKGYGVTKFVDFVDRLPHDQKVTYLQSRVRANYPKACQLIGKKLFGEDQNPSGFYFRKIQEDKNRSWNYRKLQEDKGKAKAKNIKEAVKKSLHLIFGDPYSIDGSNLEFRFTIGSWLIKTFVFVDRKNLLHYMHVIPILSQDIPYLPLLASNYLAILGIAATKWDLITDEDVPEASDVLTLVCDRFLNALPSMLNGLTPLENPS